MAGKEVIHLSPAIIVQKSVEPDRPLHHGAKMEIFNRLRELRTSLAKEERLPSYCIFHDRTLRDMARALPATPEEFLRIVGVGEVTLRKYGKAFLWLLNQIRDEN